MSLSIHDALSCLELQPPHTKVVRAYVHETKASASTRTFHGGVLLHCTDSAGMCRAEAHRVRTLLKVTFRRWTRHRDVDTDEMIVALQLGLQTRPPAGMGINAKPVANSGASSAALSGASTPALGASTPALGASTPALCACKDTRDLCRVCCQTARERCRLWHAPKEGHQCTECRIEGIKGRTMHDGMRILTRSRPSTRVLSIAAARAEELGSAAPTSQATVELLCGSNVQQLEEVRRLEREGAVLCLELAEREATSVRNSRRKTDAEKDYFLRCWAEIAAQAEDQLIDSAVPLS